MINSETPKIELINLHGYTGIITNTNQLPSKVFKSMLRYLNDMRIMGEGSYDIILPNLAKMMIVKNENL
jgi:hypothetical protein